MLPHTSNNFFNLIAFGIPLGKKNGLLYKLKHIKSEKIKKKNTLGCIDNSDFKGELTSNSSQYDFETVPH